MESKNTPLKWIYKNTKPFFLSITFLIILGVLLSLCGVAFALISRNVIDIATKQIQGNLLMQSIILGIFILGQMILQVIFAFLNVRTLGKINISFKKNLFSTLLTKDWRSVSDYHSGELLNRINGDIKIVTSAIVGIVPSLISFLTRIGASFTVLFFMDPVFALICFIAAPLVIVISRFYRKEMKGLHKECQESDGKTRSFMQEALQNLLIIKSFNNEGVIVEESTKLQKDNFLLTLKRNNISIIANMCFYIAITVGYYFALAWGAFKISKGLMSFGTLTAILQLVGQIQTPIRELSGIMPRYYSMIASAERVMELEDLSEEKEFNNEDIDCDKIYKDMTGIILDNVTFSYGKGEEEKEDEKNVLENAMLNIKKGDFVAITGSSGIGKSTLLKLLLGIIMPDSGDIWFDIKDNHKDNTKDNYKDDTKVKIDKYTRGLFAYVPQGNMILSGSIRDNIIFSKTDIDDKYLIEASKVAEIWDFIDTLPKKLDTVLGEGGLGLSEGQIQRIAIARAVIHNSPILLLDEATSALDEDTEILVLNNLKKLKTKTCIVISHRKAVLNICNKRICIENKKIVTKS